MKKVWALWALREAMKSATPVHFMFDLSPLARYNASPTNLGIGGASLWRANNTSTPMPGQDCPKDGLWRV